MVKGVFGRGGWDLPSSTVDRLLTLVGPHEVHSDSEEPWVNTRGILMGGPLTWFLLNLLNYFCAWKALGGGRFTKALQKVRICGDDMVSIMSKQQIAEYAAACASVGFQLNRSKSFVSRDSGVFAEESFFVKFQHSFEQEPFPPLVGAPEKVRVTRVHHVAPSGCIPAKVFRVSTGTPPWHTIGPSLAAAVAPLSATERVSKVQRCRRLLGVTMPALTTSILKSGIDAFAPRSLGGAELPWGSPGLATRRACSVLASDNLFQRAISSGDGGALLAAGLGSAYQAYPSEPLPMEMALMDIPATRVWVPPLKGDVQVPPNIGNWETLVRDAEALHYRAFILMGICAPPSSNDNSVPSMGRVGRAVRSAVARVISAFPQAPPTSPALPSLAKVRARVGGIVALPMQDSLTQTLNPGSRKERIVACGIDVSDNRRILHKLIPPELLPSARVTLVPG